MLVTLLNVLNSHEHLNDRSFDDNHKNKPTYSNELNSFILVRPAAILHILDGSIFSNDTRSTLVYCSVFILFLRLVVRSRQFHT